MPNYDDDRAYSDQFIPRIRQICGPLLLEPAPLELDTKQATDLMVFKARDMRIAARVRRKGYADKYRYEFTIRSARDSGAETEMSKIQKGFGDWLFYGHEAGPAQIEPWFVIDLHAFRYALMHDKRASSDVRLKCQQMSNGDGTHFLAYDVRHFPRVPPILVAASMSAESLVAA